MGRTAGVPRDLVGVHVLVVDDDPGARDLLRSVLRCSGALVTVVTSAPDALRILERVTPDALLADISMPVHDGYWLIQSVRALPKERGGAIPAIAMTGHSPQQGPERTLASGFQAYLRKPIDPWELRRAIAAVVRRS
ncbi:MAG: response regulator [Candidatus Rokubacteria bacterium]|nr:response regulator [Candidatus Rokubacteria bacterium]